MQRGAGVALLEFVSHHHADVGAVASGTDQAGDEDHGEAFAGALGVPNNAAAFGGGGAAAELLDNFVGGAELVFFGVGEVDEFDGGVLFAGLFVGVYLGFEEELLDGFVGFEQGAVGLAEDLVLQGLDLFGGEPGGVVGGVEGGDRLSKHIGEEPLTKAGTQALGGVCGDALAMVEGLPAEGFNEELGITAV